MLDLYTAGRVSIPDVLSAEQELVDDELRTVALRQELARMRAPR